MTKRAILPTTFAAIALAWSTSAYADDPNGVASDTAQKANDAADSAKDKACDETNKAAHHAKNAKKSADGAVNTAKKTTASGTKAANDASSKADAALNDASSKTSSTANKAKSSVDRSAEKAKSNVDESASSLQTSEVETTSGNIFAAEQPTGNRPNKTLLGGSIGLLALSYVPAAIVGIASPKGTDAWMALPVVGPWIALGEGSSARPWTGDVAIAADGVIQGIAAVGIVTSFVVPDAELPLGMNSKLRVTPTTMGKDGYGVGAGGVF